jgi:hypothetical protein
MNDTYGASNTNVSEGNLSQLHPPPFVHRDLNEIPPWIHILHGLESRLDARLNGIESQLQKQGSNWQNLEQILQSQNDKIKKLEDKIEAIIPIPQTVKRIDAQVIMLNERLHTQGTQITEFQDSVEVINDLYEGIRNEKTEVEFNMESLQKQLNNMQSEIKDMSSNHEQQQETILDLQCRSMQYNLIFHGIREDEINPGESENTEQKLKFFIKNTLEIKTDIQLEKVHRLGRRKRDQLKPRPILAKFKDLKDRDNIRFTAPVMLKDTNFGIREQFPHEIENRRKQLYPKLKEAKQNGKSAKLIRDKLYIENERIFPENNESETQRSHEPRRHEHKTYTSKHENYAQKTTYTNTKYKSNPKRSYEQNYRVQATDIQTPNRFQVLSHIDDEDRQSTYTGKRPARSPIEMSMGTKKHREHSPGINSSETSNNEEIQYINIDQEQASETHQPQSNHETPLTVFESSYENGDF